MSALKESTGGGTDQPPRAGYAAAAAADTLELVDMAPHVDDMVAVAVACTMTGLRVLDLTNGGLASTAGAWPAAAPHKACAGGQSGDV